MTARNASPDRPKQAVIVAGGRGTRLKPVTDLVPKPLVPFHGVPFMQYLVELLRDQGFERLLLLLGYRADQVIEHFGDGGSFGVAIEHAVSDPDDETGRRMLLAADRLDPLFLFLYCDNYWPMRWERLWHDFVASGASAQVTVYRNADRYSRDNVRIDGDRVVAYDRTRSSAGLAGVEIGYAVLSRSTIDLVGDGDAPFEARVYPALVARRELAAHVTDHRYYSVGSLERLPLTERFLARRPTVFLDRDGVLNVRPLQARYVTNWSEFHWLPGALEALGLLSEARYRVLVISNQAGIARGAMTAADLESIHARMLADVEAAGARIDAIYHCPHDWDSGCECRKPRPGMLYQAQRDFDLDLTRCLLIGDDERDAAAAEEAGCPSILVSEERPLLSIVKELAQVSVREAVA